MNGWKRIRKRQRNKRRQICYGPKGTRPHDCMLEKDLCQTGIQEKSHQGQEPKPPRLAFHEQGCQDQQTNKALVAQRGDEDHHRRQKTIADMIL